MGQCPLAGSVLNDVRGFGATRNPTVVGAACRRRTKQGSLEQIVETVA